jgi:hypothetical protein
MKRQSQKLKLNRESIRVLTAEQIARAAGGRISEDWTNSQHADLCTVTEKAGGCWVTSVTAPNYC